MKNPGLGKTFALLGQLWGYTAPRGDWRVRGRIAAAFSALVAARGSNIITPLLYGAAIDMVNDEAGFSLKILLLLVAGYALARLGQQVFSEAKQYLFASVAQRAVRGAAITCFAYLHQLSLRFHLERQTGGLTRAIDRGAKGIEFLLTIVFFEVLPLFVEVLLVSIILWSMFGGFYAAVTILTVAAYAYFTIRVTEWRIKFRREMNEADEEAAVVVYVVFSIRITEWRTRFVREANARDNQSNSRAIDSLLNYETVKYFNAEGSETERYDEALKKYETMAVRSRTSLSVVNIGQGTIIAIGMMLMMGMAGLHIQEGKLTVGDFVAVNTYLLQLYVPLNFLGWFYRELRQALVDMERMFSFLDEPVGVRDRDGASDIAIDGGSVSFEDVHFSYKDRPILQGISFTVPKGKRVAIVGPSGSGKTTISRLLFRFYDPDKGTVRIDGHNLTEVTQSSVRASIGMVPQDTVMFNATIGYNIGYGRDGATPAEIEDASRMAAIDGFIDMLPEKYDTMVGERGLKLSGGEKKRVAIARAILKGPSIFLFDEATSALDSRTEKEIQASLNEVSKARTTLVIAHRLSTIIDADEILVLSEGRIVERGGHAALLAMNGLYKQMWDRQSKGFADGEAPSGDVVPLPQTRPAE